MKSYSRKQKHEKTFFEKGIEMIIMNNFKDFSKFAVFAEVRKYRPMEDESIFNQQNEILPEVVEVYFNGEFLCDLVETMMPSVVLDTIEKNLYYKITSKAKKN